MLGCKMVPSVKNKEGQEVMSELFASLDLVLKDRQLTKVLWGLSRVPGALTIENPKFDTNGELTLESLLSAKELQDANLKVDELARLKLKTGITNRNGFPSVFGTASDAIGTAIEFNDSTSDFVAKPTRVSEGYNVSVGRKTLVESSVPRLLKFKRDLNNKLVSLLGKMGFGVSFLSDPTMDSVFNPLNAERNADGLINVIEIARGERGEEDFPEEFSHVIIEGLKSKPLCNRLLAVINEDVIRDVLGDKYDGYYEAYKGDFERLKREAAAHLLADAIVNGTNSPLLNRIWELAKSHITRVSVDDVMKVIEDAKNSLDEIVSKVEDESIIDEIDVDKIMSSKQMFALSNKVNKMEEIAKSGENLLSRKLKLLATQSESGEYDESLVDTIKKVRKEIGNKKYVTATLSCMSEAVQALTDIQEQLKQYINIKKTLTNLQDIRHISRILRSIKEYNDSYRAIFNDLSNIKALMAAENIDLNEDDATRLETLAKELNAISDDNLNAYNKIKTKIITDFIMLFYSEEKLKNVKDSEGNQMTLAMIIDRADRDANFFDKTINSIGDASDPLLSIIHSIVKETKDERDRKVREYLSLIEAATDKLYKAGYNTEFMYELDEDGVPTGYVLSDYNFSAYFEDRKKYIQHLKEDKTLSPLDKRNALIRWELDNTETIVVDEVTGREERVPISSNPRYYTKDRVKNTLSQAQYEYWKEMIELKSKLDSLIPAKFSSRFMAVQMPSNIAEGFDSSKPFNSVQNILSNIKDNFVRREFDTDFGEVFVNDNGDVTIEDYEKSAPLDLSQKEIKRIPINYIHKLSDMRRLSRDFSSSMRAYADTTVNYGEMNSIVDVLEVIRDHVNSRLVTQRSGGSKIINKSKILGKEVSTESVLPGSMSNIGPLLADFYDMAIYGKKKKDEGYISIPVSGIKIDSAKTIDALKSYSSIVRMGLNLFSGISNITMGEVNMIIESSAGEFFGIKDLAKATKDYTAMLPEFLGELNAVQKKSKMSLLARYFNALEDLSDSNKDTDYSKNTLKRIIGNSSLMFMNRIGEHELHLRTMLAILNRTKFSQNGKQIQFLDAIDIVQDEKGAYRLHLKPNISLLDGTILTEDTSVSLDTLALRNKAFKQFDQMLKNRVKRANQTMHGAYNQDDLGAINRSSLGRLAMQFRQWMPAHYNRRFQKAKYDAQLGYTREGYYRTAFRFMGNLLVDLRQGELKYKQLKDNLSELEKANLRRCATEITFFVALVLLCRLLGNVDDHKGNWGLRMLSYQARRLKMEVGASIPWISMVENIGDIVKSPIPSATLFEDALDLIKVWNMFDEIESGPYKGHSEYYRDFMKSIPLAGQIKRTIDIADQDYMFAIYN